jgi:hypothetical protein
VPRPGVKVDYADVQRNGTSEKVQACDIEHNLRFYFGVIVIRAVSKPRTDAARWCAGRSYKYWLIPVVFPKSKGHRSERTSRQSSFSNVCPLLLCVFVCVSVRVCVASFYIFTVHVFTVAFAGIHCSELCLHCSDRETAPFGHI